MVQVTAGKPPSSMEVVSTLKQLLVLLSKDFLGVVVLSPPLNPPNSGAPGVPGVAGVEGAETCSSLSILLSLGTQRHSTI